MRLVKALEVLDEKRDVVRENRGGKIVRLDATLVPKPIIVGVSNHMNVSEAQADSESASENRKTTSPPSPVRANETTPMTTPPRADARNLARRAVTKPEPKPEAERKTEKAKAEKREAEKRDEAKREATKREMAAKRDAAKRRPNTEPNVATAQRLRRVS